MAARRDSRPELQIDRRFRLELVEDRTSRFRAVRVDLSAPERVAAYLWETFFEREARELLVLLLADARNVALGHAIAAVGGRDRCTVDVGYIMATAILSHASRLILAHNHFADPSPTAADLHTASRVADACDLHGVRFLDFLVVAPTGWYASSRGLMREEPRLPWRPGGQIRRDPEVPSRT